MQKRILYVMILLVAMGSEVKCQNSEPKEIISGLDALSDIEKAWGKAYVHVCFTKTLRQDGGVQLKYFSKLPNYPSERIAKMTSGVRVDILKVDLMKYGNLVRIRRVSQVVDGNSNEMRQNILAVYDGKITRSIGYPEEKSVDEAFSSNKKPLYDISRPDMLKLDSNEDPILFLREALGIRGALQPAQLITSLVGLKWGPLFSSENSNYIVRFEGEFQTGEILFKSVYGYLPAARIYGVNKNGVEGDNQINYMYVSEGAVYFPKEVSMKTYFVDGLNRMLMRCDVLKTDMVEIKSAPPKGVFDTGGLPGVR